MLYHTPISLALYQLWSPFEIQSELLVFPLLSTLKKRRKYVNSCPLPCARMSFSTIAFEFRSWANCQEPTSILVFNNLPLIPNSHKNLNFPYFFVIYGLYYLGKNQHHQVICVSILFKKYSNTGWIITRRSPTSSCWFGLCSIASPYVFWMGLGLGPCSLASP